VWEIIAVVRDHDGDAARPAGYLEIPLGLVQAAIAYYGDSACRGRAEQADETRALR
jgi:hypothetical protein